MFWTTKMTMDVLTSHEKKNVYILPEAKKKKRVLMPTIWSWDAMICQGLNSTTLSEIMCRASSVLSATQTRCRTSASLTLPLYDHQILTLHWPRLHCVMGLDLKPQDYTAWCVWAWNHETTLCDGFWSRLPTNITNTLKAAIKKEWVKMFKDFMVEVVQFFKLVLMLRLKIVDATQ